MATEPTAVNTLALFASVPPVTIYSIKIILPSDSCLPTAPSPNVISYFLPSISCRKKTLSVPLIVVTSIALPSV